MKSILITILLTINFSIYLSAQNTALDTKNGFKDFTLGDNYLKWASNIVYTNTADANIKYYQYIGSCCQQVFNYNLAFIKLGFKDDKLQVIYLETENEEKIGNNWISDQYKSIKYSLIQLYGNSTNDTPARESDVKCGWFGNKVFLILTQEYMGTKLNAGNPKAEARCTIMIGIRSKPENGF